MLGGELSYQPGFHGESSTDSLNSAVFRPIPHPTSPLKGEEFQRPPLQGEGWGGDGASADPNLKTPTVKFALWIPHYGYPTKLAA
jgi:hypothetical protein